MNVPDLPIHTALPPLRAALARDGAAAVLHAPPGAGKSTVVPLALLEEPWAADARIVMLEPRRLAARAVARRMAGTLGERVGERVGVRMRLDTRVSAATRIEVVTEGVLTRMLQDDPSLDGVGLVIFDELHERSLEADLGLALTLDARDGLAPSLRVLAMSATLDVEPVAALLGDARIVSAEGRAFDVETRYAGRGLPPLPAGRRAPAARASGSRTAADAACELAVARIVRRALDETEGDVLVFLPGAAEIRRVESLLEDIGAPIGRKAESAPRSAARIVPLFGDLDAAAQDAAIAPSPAGERKIVLATNIAETSLTIDGVRVVVDSGLVRRARFDPSTGMSRLETARVSRASAEQRRGRAGRTAPGICYRAWSEDAQRGLAAATPPEIVEADLAPLALELASWGVADARALRWLDPPPDAMLASARDLLRRLGALDRDDRITAHGRAMAALPVHPRLAHMLIEARRLGETRLGARLAALLSERDLLRTGGPDERDPDIRTRLGLLTHASRERAAGHARPAAAPDRAVDAVGRGGPAPRANRGAAARALELARRLERRLRAAPVCCPEPDGRHDAETAHDDDAQAGLLLAFAYPDRIGRRRRGGDARFALSNGRGAKLEAGQQLARAEFLVALDVDDRDRDALIRLAAPLEKADLETRFAGAIEHRDEVEWNAREQAVVARRTARLGALVVDAKPLPEAPVQKARNAMLAGLRALGLDALPWTDEARELQARSEFVRALGLPEAEDWPALDDASLAASLDWLAPWLDGVTRREHLARIPLAHALAARLGWDRVRRLDELAPRRIEVPSGSRVRVDYGDESGPAVAVRLQEVFGLDATPRVGADRVPITFKLLSPARRPVQVTRDLASFWRDAYREVRKDLRGRYPKHDWPENPLEATPSRSGVRRRSR